MLREIDIQPTDRVAFIHIPKTAGITFRTVIHPLLAQLPWCPAIIPEQFVAIPYDELLQYRLFTGHFRYWWLEKIFPSGLISLTFLREPVSRTVSHYRYLLRLETLGGSTRGDDELRMIKKMTLVEFVNSEQLYLAVDIINLQTSFWGGFEAPQEMLSANDTDDISSIVEHLKALSIKINAEPAGLPERRNIGPEHLEVAKKRLEQASFFGITERFQDSLFLLCFIFGWPPILDELRLNHGSDAEADDALHPDTRKQIEDKVALDLELYRFGQELFDLRFNEMTRMLLERYGNGSTPEAGQSLSKSYLCDLLQKHYETRRNQRNQTLIKNIGRIYLYRPSAQAEGSFGWHTVQTLPEDGPVVWSGPGKESGFDLPCPRGENLQVSFQVLMVLTPEVIEKLNLTINNIPITLQKSTDVRGTFTFTGSVPSQAMSDPFLHLVFSVPHTIAPCDIAPDNKDARPLGFLLKWVKLECLATNPNPEEIRKMDKITDPEQIRSVIAGVKFWYHQIKLAPGITTPGVNFSSKVLENLDALGLPKNAQSLRVLDIGSRDGYFAFEMERRGAQVVAIDYAPAESTGFPVAASILQSKVPYIVDNVYDLTPETYGLFDIVLFLGVIYHLRNPLLALDKIRKLMKPGGLLFVESALSTDEAIKNLDIPVWRFYPRNTLNNDETNKWAPNLPGLQMVVEEAGFRVQHSRQLGQRGYVTGQAISDTRQQYFQQLDSSKGMFGV